MISQPGFGCVGDIWHEFPSWFVSGALTGGCRKEKGCVGYLGFQCNVNEPSSLEVPKENWFPSAEDVPVPCWKHWTWGSQGSFPAQFIVWFCDSSSSLCLLVFALDVQLRVALWEPGCACWCSLCSRPGFSLQTSRTPLLALFLELLSAHRECWSRC